jgi:Cell division septal protein
MASTLHNVQPPASKREGYMKPRRRSSYSAPVVFVLVVLGIIFVMSVFFRVSDIQVVGNTHYTDEEIIRAIDIEQGDNLFFFNRFAAFARVYSKLPYIENGSVERRLPNKVIITVEETTALAYLELGEEQWTLDRNCKVLGKAAEGEKETLIPIVGIAPGTLLIGEQMQTEDQNQELVDYLADVLYQIEERGLYSQVDRVNFANPRSAEFSYGGGKYTVVLGTHNNLEHKFGMFVSVLEKLKAGDVGIIDVSDGQVAHFSPN